MITSRMIEAFRAVMLTGSVSEAAKHMYISQPAVSRLIKDLEYEVGYKLFDRKRGRIHANDEALKLFEEVIRSFVGLNKIAHYASQIKKKDAKVLRVATMPAIGLSVMPQIIADFHKRNSDANIILEIEPSTRVMQFLNAAQCDIGFVEASYTSPDLEVGAYYELQTRCVLPPNHHLKDKEIILASDLQDEPFISLDANSKTRIKVDAIFHDVGISRNVVAEVPVIHAACSLVLEGIGVSIVDPFTARTFSKLGAVSRPFRPASSFAFSAIYAHRPKSNQLVTDFLESFKEAVDSYDKYV